MTQQQIETIIHDACREYGLDSHTKTIRYKKEAYTNAEKIAVQIAGVPLVVKNSYMFCDGLDMCFFVSRLGKACVAYSGYSPSTSKDIQCNLVLAFEKAQELLDIIQRKIDELPEEVEK